tara:strand:- start:696 stop:1574 length:879 start_codon:yes stop_codon:yes gene_type:complete
MARPRKTTTTTKPQVEEVVQETVQENETVIEAPVAPKPVEVKETKKKDEWEIKSRQYYLAGGKSPLTFTLASKHTPRHPLLWFDPKTNSQREIRYATNQKSCFVDEQNGSVTMEHIVFKDGVLNVPKEKQSLQKLLSIYHPHKDRLYNEFDPIQEAEYGLEDLETELEAMTAAREIDIDHAEAILRAESGSSVSKMTSKEIRRDLMVLAKTNPRLFISLALDDNIQLRNFAIKAAEQGIIKLSQDQRTFTWASNGRKLITVPFDEHPYSAMASFFKTDEGMEIFSSIEKKLM